MKRQEVFTFVAEYLAENLPEVKTAEDVHETDDLVDDLGVHFLERVELIMTLEEKFGISISKQEEQNFCKTVAEAVDCIYQKIQC